MLAPWKDLWVSSLYLHSVSNEIRNEVWQEKAKPRSHRGLQILPGVFTQSSLSWAEQALSSDYELDIWGISIWWTQTQFIEGSFIPSGHVEEARLANPLKKVHSSVYIWFNSAGKLVNCTSMRVLNCKQYTLNPSEPI